MISVLCGKTGSTREVDRDDLLPVTTILIHAIEEKLVLYSQSDQTKPKSGCETRKMHTYLFWSPFTMVDFWVDCIAPSLGALVSSSGSYRRGDDGPFRTVPLHRVVELLVL